jgi:TonB C terminal
VPRPPIQISYFVYPTAPGPYAARRTRLSSTFDRMLRGTIAATICVLVHGLICMSVIWSAGSPPPPTRDLPPRVSVTSNAEQDAMEWVVINPDALSDPSRPKTELPSAPMQPIDVRKELTKVAILVPDIDLPPSPDATVADAARFSKLYGRYVGQIAARIDRAWLRPRTAIGAPTFSCQVRISQDASGNVQELILEDCNGDSRWQLSLVNAIQSASPLPAPPDPDVFSRTLHLAFNSEGYSAASSADQFEPELTARVAESETATQ